MEHVLHLPDWFIISSRPGRSSASATGRGILSMQGLSHGVVRVDTENSLTSLTLQDCGQVMPGGITIQSLLTFVITELQA